VMELELERFIPPFPRDGSLPETEPLRVRVELIEEPRPGGPYIRLPSADLRREDELRLGLLLSDITRPLAEHFGLAGPEGVLIAMPPLPGTAAAEAGIELGDVLLEIMGQPVNRLHDVQAVVDSLDEDEPLEVLVRRGSQDQTYMLVPLGPSVPGANQFPPEVRRRLADAIARGDLDASRVEIAIRQDFWSDDPEPGVATLRIGPITALSPGSITIEVYSTGRPWTLDVTPETEMAGPGAFDDLSVGEYVQVFTQDGRTAMLIVSLAEPLPDRP